MYGLSCSISTVKILAESVPEELGVLVQAFESTIKSLDESYTAMDEAIVRLSQEGVRTDPAVVARIQGAKTISKAVHS